MLACVFLIELVTAAVLPAHPAPAPATSVETLTPVGDRAVRLTSAGGSEQLLARVASGMGGAVEAVVGFWGRDWPREISVLATGTDEQFRVAAGGGPAAQWADIAAVTVAEHVDPASRSVTGQRIVFAPGAAGMSAGALRIVLTHELFHYAARADTALDAPRWLTEGVADYVARPPAPLPADAAPAAASLPSDQELDTPGPSRTRAYDRAWWFTRFVADSYGPAKLRELYLAACGPGHADVPTAAERVLGVDATALLARWQEWVTWSG
ncbi:hypothetical protein A9X01_08700 [Mycobacterium asiaticum]|uniref:DUF4157 domain-containing protein n=1 Tax=Mycobacterium asiaticum TaxID=1790 RepID=A0A1A3D1G8_MYCAS|nr:hypothetical protein A9X01_08700 [Mycobacterium asiaticum]